VNIIRARNRVATYQEKSLWSGIILRLNDYFQYVQKTTVDDGSFIGFLGASEGPQNDPPVHKLSEVCKLTK
jgi:hypothetical protein